MKNSINKHPRLKVPYTAQIFNLLIAFAKPNLSQKYIFSDRFFKDDI
jgi:hypothetical protein